MPDHDTDAPLELRLQRIVWRIDDLERNAKSLRVLYRGLRSDVDGLTVEEKVTAGVAAALRDRTAAVADATAARVSVTGGPIVLTWPQKIGGAAAGALLVLDAVRGLVS